MSPAKQKILLLLLGGLAFSFSRTSRNQWRVVREVSHEWKRINKKELQHQISQLYRSKLIDKKYDADGNCSIVLTEKGKIKTLRYKFSEMKIKNGAWDGRWRIVVFDIPERIRKGRDAMRWKLKELGFRELQKSAFVFPYECKNEIEFIIEYFELRKYVRYGTLDFIDNALHLKEVFGLK